MPAAFWANRPMGGVTKASMVVLPENIRQSRMLPVLSFGQFFLELRTLLVP